MMEARDARGDRATPQREGPVRTARRPLAHRATPEPVHLIEDTGLRPTEWGLFALPLALHLVLAFLVDPLLLPVALGVALLTAATAYLWTRDPLVVAVAAAVAPLYTTAMVPGLMALLAAAALFLASWTRFPMLFALGAAVALVPPDPAWAGLVAVGAAAAVAAPARHRGLPWWSGVPLAAALILLGGLLQDAWIAVALGALAGAVTFYLFRHPGLPGVARVADRLAPWSAILPALFLFLLAAVGRSAAVGPIRQLAVAWGALALGGLVVLGVWGAAWMTRASDRIVPGALAAFPAFVMVIPALVFAAGLAPSARAVAGLWVLFALPVALGLHRIAHVAGSKRAWVLGAAIALIATANGMRLWLD